MAAHCEEHLMGRRGQRRSEGGQRSVANHRLDVSDPGFVSIWLEVCPLVSMGRDPCVGYPGRRAAATVPPNGGRHNDG